MRNKKFYRLVYRELYPPDDKDDHRYEKISDNLKTKSNILVLPNQSRVFRILFAIICMFILFGITIAVSTAKFNQVGYNGFVLEQVQLQSTEELEYTNNLVLENSEIEKVILNKKKYGNKEKIFFQITYSDKIILSVIYSTKYNYKINNLEINLDKETRQTTINDTIIKYSLIDETVYAKFDYEGYVYYLEVPNTNGGGIEKMYSTINQLMS